MKLKKILFWILFGIISFNVFNYLKMHTRGDVIAYKRFAKSMMKGDAYDVRQVSNPQLASQVMMAQERRMEAYENLDIVITYYRIRDRKVSEDGKIVTLVGDQISRVNPDGVDTLWGAEVIKARHVVTLEMQNNSWKVQKFDDAAMAYR